MATFVLTVAEFNAFPTKPFAPEDDVTIADVGQAIDGLTPTDLAAFAAANVDVIDATNDSIFLSTSQLEALGNVRLTAEDTVVLADNGAELGSGSIAQISSLAARNIDRIDVTDDVVSFTLAQLNALPVSLSPGDAVILTDSGETFSGLSPADIAGLSARGVISFNATDDALRLSVEQYRALGSVALTGNDVVQLIDSAAALATLTTAELADLGSRGIDVIDSTDNFLNLTLEQFDSLGSVGLTAADTVTVSDLGAQLAVLTPAQIANLAAKGVDVLDASDNALTLTAAQAAALAGGGTSVAAGDTVLVVDAGAALSALTPAQLAALNGKGIDALNASDNVLALSVAQLNALGSIGLTADDAVRLTDIGSALSGLSAGQIAGLAARGVDTLDATDNALILSLAQYQSLGALQIAVEDRVTINGTSASERVDGRANNEYIKGFGGNDRLNGGDGNDWLSGGTGKDVLTGGRGADGFVFDTKPNKKTNYDTVKDFNVRDDSFYLDNAIFKKLGKGSEASPGKLKKGYFEVGTKADDRNDYLIYNKKTGVLYYDADGSGSAKQVEIAKLSKNLKLTEKDFFII